MSPLRIVLVTLALASCTDSELQGLQPIDQDGFADSTGDSVIDTADGEDTPDGTEETSLPDVPDTVDTVDTTDTVDTNDVDSDDGDTRVEVDVPACTSDESCRAVLGELGPCVDPVCDLGTGTCHRERREDCCARDSDCPETGDPCLRNLCPVPGGGCVALTICDPCQVDGDCPSNDPCQLGRCGADGECSFEPNPSCAECQEDGQCTDGVECTRDECIQGNCVHEPAPGCCVLDTDCKDDDPCTRDFCRQGSGICGFEQIPGCTECSPELCDDFDPCTQDFCTDLGCTHITDPDCRGCQSNVQCNDGDACTTDICDNARCFHEQAIGPDGAPICACEGDEQCEDNDFCTLDICDGQQCFHIPDMSLPECQGCGGSSCDDFDDCTTDFCDGMTCQHIFNTGFPGCEEKCTSDDQCPNGDQCTKSFCDAQIGTCVVVSVPDCCNGVGQCNDQDRCTEDACLDDGRCWHADIPGCNTNECEGVMCNDGDPCTEDRCDSTNGCVFTPISNCILEPCRVDQDCQDASDCTKNSCIDNVCENVGIPGCCDSDFDCRDGDPCTTNECEGADRICVARAIDCDDGDPCTVDQCGGFGFCESSPAPTLPGCECQAVTLWQRGFNSGEEGDVTIDGSGFGVRWRVDDVRPFDGSGSLHYGDEDGDDYDTGFRNFGRATGPQVQVPSNTGEVRLEFMVYVDVDFDPERDSFVARWLIGQQNEILWDRLELGEDQLREWIPVSVVVPAPLGETIQIRFVFDSLDGEGNEGQGVFVDDVVLYTTCP